MKFHLLIVFLAALLPIANACLSISVEWNPDNGRVQGIAKDNGVVRCTMDQRKYEKQLWFDCQPGFAAYITRDFKLFAWHAHDADYRIDAYHDVNLAGTELRWANSFGCTCGGWKCLYGKVDDRSGHGY
ncbi:hypothetical protein VF21_02648 [Pseudogymnoascus sp. 05NY08]|nr:hypothetical protein VF21_02648 [Pseudogymnoascus sp. 05NY08]